MRFSIFNSVNKYKIDKKKLSTHLYIFKVNMIKICVQILIQAAHLVPSDCQAVVVFQTATSPCQWNSGHRDMSLVLSTEL